ncbi:hypothetical protein OPV22_019542 [Ensete ventricosum]|uniref:RIN4 pathogenic type III effector avirulence factor Avr cleavage site domain-containing protein n=1 Tax=Ensete ventricosum TaxID=4639 RepID=A0AAV8QE27_ENSVE|nr:hypothetical protein OPV22_019542 [Ensete ventricosum]
MAQQAQMPQFGNWETARDVPSTQCFNHARRRKSGRNATNSIDPNESLEAHVKAASSPIHAAPSTTESNADTTKPKDTNSLKINSGNFRRTATPPPDNYVFVPPFAGWDEKDSASDQRHTEVFNKVDDDQITPGIPFKPSQPSSQKQKSTEPKMAIHLDGNLGILFYSRISSYSHTCISALQEIEDPLCCLIQ